MQEMRQKLEEDLEQKLPAKGAEEKNRPNPSPSDAIKLNVGGDTSFTTRRDTLTSIPNSRLAQLFCGRWDSALRRDGKGRVFLDVDPVQFRALLAWLVDMKRIEPDSPSPSPPTASLPASHRSGFKELCIYLCGPNAGIAQHGIVDSCNESSNPVEDPKPLRDLKDSLLVSPAQAKQLSTWLKEAPSVAGKPCFKLLFRASRDGFSNQAFHQKCDQQGPTVVVAKSAGGHLFGGYTETSWDSNSNYKNCREAFLFRLGGPGNIQPSKHAIFQNHQQGIYCNAGYAPTFGGGHDLRIYPEGAAAKVAFNMNNSTYSCASPQGNFTYLAEAQQAVVTDYEVFALTSYMDLGAAAESLQAHAEQLQSQLGQSEQDFLRTVLDVCAAALDQGSQLNQAKNSLKLSRMSVDEEAQFLTQFMGTSADIICLNVGGKLMETLQPTLTFLSDSTLAKKFEGSWTLQSDEMVEGGVFFDEDSELFQVVLLHLRLGRLLGSTFSPKLPPGKAGPWKRLLKYFNLQALLKNNLDSELLDAHGEALLAMLQESTQGGSGTEVSLNLIFRASRDGFSNQAFHQKCDQQGPTVVVAKSAGGHLFGGYTETSWDSNSNYKNCREAFLFRLGGPGNIQPSKHAIFQSHPHGIYCNAGYAATFGGGHDLRIYPEGAAAKVAFIVGNTYQSGSPQGNFTHLAEAQQAVVTDYEVFAVVRT